MATLDQVLATKIREALQQRGVLATVRNDFPDFPTFTIAVEVVWPFRTGIEKGAGTVLGYSYIIDSLRLDQHFDMVIDALVLRLQRELTAGFKRQVLDL